MKYLGMIMIILVSSYLGLMITRYKKEQIKYLDNVIYMGTRIKMLLGTTMPSTNGIFNDLSSDDRLSNLDIDKGRYILNENDFNKIKALISSVGLYDADTQISMLGEFNEYFTSLMNTYKNEYNKSYKLYIIGGLSVGILISILLI